MAVRLEYSPVLWKYLNSGPGLDIVMIFYLTLIFLVLMLVLFFPVNYIICQDHDLFFPRRVVPIYLRNR